MVKKQFSLLWWRSIISIAIKKWVATGSYPFSNLALSKFISPSKLAAYTETVFLELVDSSPLAYLAAKSSKETCLILLALPAVPKAS